TTPLLNGRSYPRLAFGRPYVAYDLPAGGKRLLQKADGYDATIVSGIVTYRDGAATGHLPGRLVKGQRGAKLMAAEEGGSGGWKATSFPRAFAPGRSYSGAASLPARSYASSINRAARTHSCTLIGGGAPRCQWSSASRTAMK